MSDRLSGGILSGSLAYRTSILLKALGTNVGLTGKAAADVTAAYMRQGEAPVAIAVVDLAAVDAAYTPGGLWESSAALKPGSYTLDVPDAAFVPGTPDWVEISAFTADSFVFTERFPLASAHAASLRPTLDGIAAQTVQLSFGVDGVNATTPAVADAATIATAVWARVVEQQGAITAQQALSIGLAALAGVTTAQGATFLTPDGTTVRIVVIPNVDNERTSVVLTPSAPA